MNVVQSETSEPKVSFPQKTDSIYSFLTTWNVIILSLLVLPTKIKSLNGRSLMFDTVAHLVKTVLKGGSYQNKDNFQGGQSSQVHQGSGIHILKISSNFYILLISLRGANPENFSSIRVMKISSILGGNFQKYSDLQSLETYSLEYMLRLI